MNVLIKLHRGYGLGDAVQMSAVLKHVVKYRPDWKIDYQAEEGKHCVGRGIVDFTLSYDDPLPNKHYDAEVEIRLYNTWLNWYDRPNTRVSSALHECFGLEWDEECGRYQVQVSKDDIYNAWEILPTNTIALHYQGDSAKDKKDLNHDQAATICDNIKRLGKYPLLLDWRNQWKTRHIPQVMSTGGYEFSSRWGADAGMNCAIISQCWAFIGIDSGPSKCASATDTPSLVIWTKHHPAEFHDPAPNTTHLVPYDYHSLHPVNNDQPVIKWFEAHYDIIKYTNEFSMQTEVVKWLRSVL